jgi:hypothetical protein
VPTHGYNAASLDEQGSVDVIADHEGLGELARLARHLALMSRPLSLARGVASARLMKLAQGEAREVKKGEA